MGAVKRRLYSSRGTSRLHHHHRLPSLSLPFSPCPSQPAQPPSTTALYATNLKEEAIYLASILHARLSDSANGGDGRGLLSRALVRGELDEFLVSYFSDPTNQLYAREKVEARRAKIAKSLAKRRALLGHCAKVSPPPPPAGEGGQGCLDSIERGDFAGSMCSSATHTDLHACPQAHHHHFSESRRFGPVLADSGGILKSNFSPGRDARNTINTQVVTVERGGVLEPGSNVNRAMSEHNGSDHDHRHQQQQDEAESVRSCCSLSTLHSESEESRCTNAISVGRSALATIGIGGCGHRKEKQKQRRKRRDSDRNKDSRSRSPPAPAVDSIHFEGHLLHRVCEVTGSFPGDGDGGSSNSDVDSADERSEMSLLEDSGEYQLARLRRNPKMMGVLVRLKALSTSLVNSSGRVGDPGSSKPPGCAAYDVTGGGRRVDVVRFAQQEYLRLFEEMLGELLRTQRDKSKAFRAEKRALQRELERAHEAEAATRGEAEVHAIQLDALLAVKKALAAEVATQKVQLEGFEAEVEARAKIEMATKQEHFAAEAKKAWFMNEMKKDEQTMRNRFKEVEVEATRAEMAIRSMEHLTAKVERTAAINKQIYRVDESKYKKIKETSESCCQTIANDDGLWDFQDGLTRQVSRNIFQRLKWQALRRFASCPSCHGLGPYTVVRGDKDKRELAPSKERAEEDPTLSHQHFQHKQGKSKGRRRKAIFSLDKAWAMPNVLVEFMIHLPKTAMALPVKPLRWLTREIWLILDERERIDAIDEQEGQKVQDMNDFMVELFLRRHSLRQDAELQLFIFLVSVKAHYKKSAAVHTFARLMDLLHDPTTSHTHPTMDVYGVGGHDHHDFGIKGKHSKDKKDKEIKEQHFKREEELLERAVHPHDSPLGAAFIPVLLFTRRALLKRPKVDLQALHREKIRQRFTSAASVARLQQTVMSTFKGFAAPPDGAQQEPPPTNDIMNYNLPDESNGLGGLSHIDEAAATSSSSCSHAHPALPTSGCSGTEAKDMGFGEGNGGGVQGDTKDRPGGPTNEDTQKIAPIAVASDRHRQETASAVSSWRSISNSGIPRDSGAPTGGLLDRTKSVATMLDRTKNHAAMIDRGNKKKATPVVAMQQRSTGTAASQGAQGSTKKNAGSNNVTGRKTTTSSSPSSSSGNANTIREEHQHQQDKGSGAAPAEVPIDTIEAMDLPKHVLTEDNCTFWVSLEMAVRVLTVALHWCNPMKRHAYMRSIEKYAALLTSRGHITGVEASHSFIRSAMRKTIAVVEAGDGAGGGGDRDRDRKGVAGITETMGSISGTFEEGCGVGGVVSGDAAMHDARIIIDMDRVIELVMEVMLLRQNSIEHRLKALFTEGDDNEDGVLTFEEFNKIVGRAAPHFSERRVLRMFREALMSGSEGSYAIEKDTFCNVCRQHGLVQLIDIAHLEKAAERGPAAPAPIGLRLLSSINHGNGPPPGASRTAAATHRAPTLASTPETATAVVPTKIKLDTAAGVPLGMDQHDLDPNDNNGADSNGPTGDGEGDDGDAHDKCQGQDEDQNCEGAADADADADDGDFDGDADDDGQQPRGEEEGEDSEAEGGEYHHVDGEGKHCEDSLLSLIDAAESAPHHLRHRVFFSDGKEEDVDVDVDVDGGRDETHTPRETTT